MKTCFVIASTIYPSQVPLTYSQVRSKFDPEERLRQTVYTVNSIQSQVPNATIYLVDSSEDHQKINDTFKYFNVRVISPPEEIRKVVNTHPHKSYCECLLLNNFFETHKKEISTYDFIFKATGRYVYNLRSLSEVDSNKMYFKKPNCFPWKDEWNYQFPLVDTRTEELHNELRQYCTVLYGFGSEHLHKIKDIYTTVMNIIDQRQYSHYDVEGLTYALTRGYKPLIEETNWLVTGFDGTSGRLMYY
jgi:hypothetical protein